MANGAELNLTTHRSAANVWNRRGWNGSREIAIIRWLIGVGGGVLAIEGFRRRSLVGSLLAGAGGGIAWWAMTGEPALPDPRRWLANAFERAGWSREDLIHESSAESFPASDPPSWTPTIGTGLRNRRVNPRTESAPSPVHRR